MIFQWILNDSKIFSGLLSILTDFSSAVVWMVSTLPLISSSLNLFSWFFENVLRAPKMICITAKFMFNNFFCSLAKSTYVSSFSTFFHCNLLAQQNSRGDKFYSPCLLKLGLDFWPGSGGPFVSEYPRKFYASLFLAQILVCAHTICQKGEISVSSTILCGLPFPPSRAYSDIPLMLV